MFIICVLFVHLLSSRLLHYTDTVTRFEPMIRAIHSHGYTFRVRDLCMILDIQLHIPIFVRDDFSVP